MQLSVSPGPISPGVLLQGPTKSKVNPIGHQGPRVGVTKPISSVPSIFSIVKTHVRYWISCLYLTGVTTAQLQGHLSNINVIQFFFIWRNYRMELELPPPLDCLLDWLLYWQGWLTLNYHQVSNISYTLVGNKIVGHSDVVGASPVGAAPTTSSFLT